MNEIVSYVVMGIFGFVLASIIYIPEILSAKSYIKLQDNYIHDLEGLSKLQESYIHDLENR